MGEWENSVADMKALGFSTYECKAYLALLRDFPLNGYALSKSSGIPRSRIYEVLKNLMEKQMVFEEVQEKTKIYTPVPPKIFVQKAKERYSRIFDAFSQFAQTLYQEPGQDDNQVILKGRDNIISFLKVLINGAKSRLALSIWDEELCELTNEIEAARERQVKVCGIYFGNHPRFDDLVPHRRIQRYQAEKKERYLCAIVDHSHMVSGIVSRAENAKATWSRDEGLIEISEDYIAHDLVVNLYSASLNKSDYLAFEQFAESVHHRFYGYAPKDRQRYTELMD